MLPDAKQLEISNALDVAAVERVLADLWQSNAGEITEEGGALLRARALNFMVFLRAEAELAPTNQVIVEFTSSHPCRALVMVGETEAPDRDIEIFVSAFCETSEPTRDHQLCCEEIALVARGRYVVELASAATPLLVTDLPAFLWWRDGLNRHERLFGTLLRASDRLIIDSAESDDPTADFLAIPKLLKQSAIGDLNWTRLNAWRMLLAGFYDVAEHRDPLKRISKVQIDYTPPKLKDEQIAPQALLIAGWLASRLEWELRGAGVRRDGRYQFLFEKGNQTITLELNPLENSGINPGRLVYIKLATSSEKPGVFEIRRSDDGSHLQSKILIGDQVHPSRILAIRRQELSELLRSELDVLARDRVFEEAVGMAVQLIRLVQ